MLLFQNIPSMPWWAVLIIALLWVVSAALNVIQLYKSRDAVRWKSASEAATATANAAISERDILRLKRDQLNEENKDLTNQVALLKAKMVKEMQEMKSEFKRHSDQDFSTSTQQPAALEAVKASLQILQGQIGK